MLPTGPLGPRAVIAEGVQRRVDDIGFALLHLFIADSQPGEAGGAVVLHYHISGFQKLVKDFQPLRGFQIYIDAAFAPINIGVAGNVVWAGWVVDLDDLRAELAKSTSAGGSGQNDTQVQHPDTFQGAHNVFFAFWERHGASRTFIDFRNLS